MRTLDEIGIETTTDKSSAFHCYLPFYDLIFSRFPRDQIIGILEIGVFHGDSIRVWRQWWPLATIVGIDNFDHGTPATKELTVFLHGNAYTHEMVQRVREGKGDWDIIIDDGTHLGDDQSFVIANYSHLLSKDGILIIEDQFGAFEGIPKLVASVPDGFWHAVVDLRTAEKNTHGSILFPVWRK